MPGHRLDAQKISGLDHVVALRRSASPLLARSPPSSRSERYSVPASVRRRSIRVFKRGEAAHAAVAVRGVLVVEEGEGVRRAAARRDVEAIEQRAADQVRRPAAHVADADIHARLAEKDRFKLGVGVGQMEDTGIAETADRVEVVVGREGRP